MFGYVRPLKGELKVSQFERYKAIYCGLCRSLGKNFGFAARFTVSYDLTFLAALLMSDDDSGIVKGRCPGCCIKKKTMLDHNSALEEAAVKSVILTWFSLKDKQADGGVLSRIGWGMVSLLFRPAIKKAENMDKDFYRITEENTRRLAQLEKDNCDSIDRTADTFASILKSSIPQNLPDEVKRPLQHMMYNIGRFIYITDAVDDYKKDRKTGAFNAVAARYGLTSDDIPKDVFEQLDVLMENCVDMCSSAAVLLQTSVNEPIISNIIYFGLPAVWQSVKAGTFNKRAKQEKS
ncbi:MAG: hypothetical protein E7430_01295 [Ruminococcaceae bacterium]|nr:hypothetical protein [Oscillospiraceae bacterium]